MKIALDWDNTYTLDPTFWDDFITRCLVHGHDIRIVTMRKPEYKIEFNHKNNKVVPVIYTANMQKRLYCDQIDWQPQIWIDDSPEFIVREDVLEFIKVFKAEYE